MIWLIMRCIAYGFEMVVVAIMAVIFIGIIAKNKPEWLKYVFNILILEEDDD